MESSFRLTVWKKLAAILLVMSILFTLTGCIRYDMKLKVHKDGLTDFVFTFALLDDTESRKYIEAYRLVFDRVGFDVEEYRKLDGENLYVGITASKKGIHIDELESLMKTDLALSGFALTKEDDVYFLSWNSRKDADVPESSSITPEMLEKYGGYMRFSLEVPGKILESNATSKSGKTLKWELLSTDGFIYAKFKLTGGGLPVWMICAIAGGVLVIAAIVTVLIVRKKKQSAPFVYSPSGYSSGSISQSNDSFESWQNAHYPMGGNARDEDIEEDIDAAPAANTPIWARPASENRPGASDEPENRLF